MRVIAGTRRGTVLMAPEGLKTRPTTDRTKETLFNVLMPYLKGAVFADFFSGSGGIAIEALSRGAEKAYLVEQDRKAAAVIRKNLEKTHFTNEAELFVTDVFLSLERFEREHITFDLVFMDPPYQKELEKQLLSGISQRNLLAEDALIIVEASLETDFGYVLQYGFEVVKVKRYKTNQHVFLQKIIENKKGGDS